MRPIDSIKMQIRGELTFQTLLCLAISFDVLAGVSALTGSSVVALTCLILQGLTLGALVFNITVGRKRILSQIIIERRKQGEQGIDLQ